MNNWLIEQNDTLCCALKFTKKNNNIIYSYTHKGAFAANERSLPDYFWIAENDN